MTPRLSLRLLPETFAVCRFPFDAPPPAWATAGAWYSVTKTADELSIVCEQARVPAALSAERDWRSLQVQGPLDFALTGILAALTGPLAIASIGIFALSTFDTDYLLVKQADLANALQVLISAGHQLLDVVTIP
jgi:hypothetical protein